MAAVPMTTRPRRRAGSSRATNGMRRRDHRGMVTVELAVSILAALALLMVLCWGIGLILLQLQCADTAGEVARQAARGDRGGVDRAKRDAPEGAVIVIEQADGSTVVRVSLAAQPFTGLVPEVPLVASAEVVTEPGEP